VVAIIALLISILLPSLARARELSKRAVCGKNLSGIGQAVATYAADKENSGFFPIPAHKLPTTAGLCEVSYVKKIGAARNSPSNTNSAAISTTRALWMLVRAPKSPVTPKLCICPSSDGMPNDDTDYKLAWDFGKTPIPSLPSAENYKQISYGMQVPFGQAGRGTMERAIQMALAADKGWYSNSQEGGQTDPGTVSASSTSTPEDWKPWNSPNHGGTGEGEGQNILFGDFHVEFSRNPIVGLGLDNIYTRWSSASNVGQTGVNDRVRGVVQDKYAPYANTDTLIYP
jgi:type II secretory pathway pseudopilin PulG